LTDADAAGVQLLSQIKEADYTSVFIGLETKSSWAAILAFLHELQTLDQFIVVEDANLKIDDEDHTRMHGHFKIARWFAPSATAKHIP
jgi:hypothetical protein